MGRFSKYYIDKPPKPSIFNVVAAITRYQMNKEHIKEHRNIEECLFMMQQALAECRKDFVVMGVADHFSWGELDRRITPKMPFAAKPKKPKFVLTRKNKLARYALQAKLRKRKSAS